MEMSHKGIKDLASGLWMSIRSERREVILLHPSILTEKVRNIELESPTQYQDNFAYGLFNKIHSCKYRLPTRNYLKRRCFK